MVCSLISPGKELIQQIIRCDWDEETDNTNGHVKFGNNGEDFITLDAKTETWFATNPNSEVIAETWNANKTKYEIAKYIIQNGCLPMLKVFVKYGKSFLNTKGKINWPFRYTVSFYFIWAYLPPLLIYFINFGLSVIS